MVVQVSKENNLWRTPKGDSPLDSKITVNKLIKNFKLKLDPCCSGPNDCLVPPERGGIYYTPKENGLLQNWKHNAIFNPPFSKIKYDDHGKPKRNENGKIMYESAIGDWCEKAISESIKHKILVVGILPLYNTQWFRDYVWDILPKGHIYMFDKRIQFLNQKNQIVKGTRFDSFMAFWDQRRRRKK